MTEDQRLVGSLICFTAAWVGIAVAVAVELGLTALLVWTSVGLIVLGWDLNR